MSNKFNQIKKKYLYKIQVILLIKGSNLKELKTEKSQKKMDKELIKDKINRDQS